MILVPGSGFREQDAANKWMYKTKGWIKNTK